MNSYLITGGAKQERFKKAKELIKSYKLPVPQSAKKTKNWPNHPDFLKIKANPSIGIQAVRNLQKFLSRKPYQNKIKVAVILQAEKLTIPAQNAFLKTLEEPPSNSKIILCCSSSDQLLATIVSRCQLIKLKTVNIKLQPTNQHIYFSFIKKILTQPIGKGLKLVEPYEKNRETAVKFLKEMIIFLRQNLIINNTIFSPKEQLVLKKNRAILINEWQKTLTLVKANVNTKLALDNLIIFCHHLLVF